MNNYKVEAWPWCADYCKKNQWNPHDSYFWDKAMLEYRRQNNIFEVLDLIMYENKLYEIKYIYHPGKARITDGFQGRTVYDFPRGIRHATDAEIAAGKRL